METSATLEYENTNSKTVLKVSPFKLANPIEAWEKKKIMELIAPKKE